MIDLLVVRLVRHFDSVVLLRLDSVGCLCLFGFMHGSMMLDYFFDVMQKLTHNARGLEQQMNGVR